MAYSTISKPGLHFNTATYAGNGGTNAITGLGFKPDLVWTKNRSATANHLLYDAVRGAGYYLYPNLINSQGGNGTSALDSFDSDGFTLDGGDDSNVNGQNGVAWSWKGASSSGSANSDGDIASTVSANTTAGFSVVKWTANGSDADTVGHGLGVAPKIVLYKNIDQSGSWYWVYKYVDGSLDYLTLNAISAKSDLTLGTYGFTTSTTITNLGFGNTHALIAYCFAEKQGYSKFGSYTGNGNTNGTFIYTGFKPAFLLVKTYTTNGGWQLYDNKRNIGNPTSKFLVPSSTAAETSGSNDIDFLSNGFKTRTTANPGTTDSFIYMAFAAEPLVANVGANGVPATAV